MASINKKINIDKFIASIDSMVASKYILIDRKISDVLLSIADTREVYNTIAECMINFDFKTEWQRAIAGQVFKLPETDERKIAFIFCMLNNIDDKNINITAILDRYFSYDKNVSSYDNFCKNIISEFKRLIVKMLSEDYIVANEVEYLAPEVNAKEEIVVLSSMVANFKQMLILQKKLKNTYVSKEDLIAMLSTFELIIKNSQLDYFYSYKVMIGSAIKKNKALKKEFEQIEKLIDIMIAR